MKCVVILFFEVMYVLSKLPFEFSEANVDNTIVLKTVMRTLVKLS